jgi:hypothetical protein
MKTRRMAIGVLLGLCACSADTGPAPKPPPPAVIHLPVFTFRTLDRAEAKVEINGALLSTTPCPWSITDRIESDTEITLPADDPKVGAKFIGSTELTEPPASKVDVYILTNPARLEKFPKLRKDEVVLIVEGTIGAKAVLAALRLRVEGYRYTDYAPLPESDGDDGSRFRRTIWFERKTD